VSNLEHEGAAQAWHEANHPISEGTCYCCCWICPDENPHYRAAMQWANNGVMDQ
jgi:hypothetical protein